MSGPFCDFHLHSSCSDGRLSPADLVDVVADAGVGVMALTDHDTLDGIDAAARRAHERGIAFVGGIEVTAYREPEVVHVLGLGVHARGPLLERNAVARQVWAENQQRWIASLEAQGTGVSLDRDFSDLPVRLPVLIERLCGRGIENGDPTAVHALFHRYFRALPAQAYTRLPSPAEAARAIRGSGGIAALAHPGRLSHEAIEGIARDVDAIEADYAAYDEKQRAELRAVARSLGKMYTCGSDYHGYFTADYQNPQFAAPAELLARLNLSAPGA
jgi:3',5'-nucleoside bisphosphate phosphatase